MRASRRSAASLAFFRSRYCLSSSCFRLRLPASIAARNCSAAAAFTLRSISSSQSSCGAAHESCRTSREWRQYHGSVSEMRSATTAGTLRHLPHDSSSHATQLSDAANRPSMDASMGRADMAAHAASTSSTVSGGGGQSAGPRGGRWRGVAEREREGVDGRVVARGCERRRRAGRARADRAPSPAATARRSRPSSIAGGRAARGGRRARWPRGSASIASTRHSRPGVSAMGAASISAMATAFAAATAAVTGMTAGGDEESRGRRRDRRPRQVRLFLLHPRRRRAHLGWRVHRRDPHRRGAPGDGPRAPPARSARRRARARRSKAARERPGLPPSRPSFCEATQIRGALAFQTSMDRSDLL